MKTVQRSAFDSSALCRSRRELSNEYLLAKIGVDTAENEPLEVWVKIVQYYSFESLLKTLKFVTSSVFKSQLVDESCALEMTTRQISSNCVRGIDFQLCSV